MKKLLALVLVLGMASMASAGLVYQINGVNYNGGETVTITGPVVISLFNTASTATAYQIGGVALDNGSIVAGAAVGENLPGAWSVTDYGYNEGYDGTHNGYVFGINYDTPAVANTLAGKLFDFTVATAGGNFVVLDGGLAPMDAGINLVVPEPMTMTLLGLGGLFFARRKN